MARRVMAHLDRPLLFAVLFLTLLGLYNLSSAGRPLGLDLHHSQGMHVVIGLALAALIMSFHYRTLEVLAIPIFAVSVVLLIGTDMFGKIVNGSRRWLTLGPINIQTSDLAKLAIILIMAKTFHLERSDGGLTLREIFRPFNVSRPLLVVIAVIAVSLFGDVVKPATLQRMVGKHTRNVGVLAPDRPPVVIGRGRDVDVRLTYEGIAERHAEIHRTGDGHYVLQDLGAEAGTWVNDERVVGERQVRDGDVVRFGSSARSEITLKAQVEKLRPKLPWVALFGAAWMFVAIFLQLRRPVWTIRDLFAPIDLVLIPAVLVLIQPDLGTAMIITLIAFTMMLYVGLRPVSLALLILFTLAGSIASWFLVLKPYQKDRVLTFLNPTSDLAGTGYHQHQSMIAIGSGGLWGQGHGQGTQTQLSFLPEQQTDFIFSVWSEEHGFVGCAVVVLSFMTIVLLGIRVVANARDRFGALLAVGVTALVFWHSTINILMVLRLAPVVGVPLPLWSNGGSFAVTILMGFGMLLSVSMRRYTF